MSAVNQIHSRYRILRKIGQGGMGTVFYAIDLRLRRSVALKVLSDRQAESSHACKRLVREGSLACLVNHPNICTIYDVDYDKTGRPFLVMEWLDGEPLTNRLARETLAVEQILELAIQITEGLDAAHSAGIIHRDIKPANIFLTVRGIAKILDFGLATMRLSSPDQETVSHLSLPGCVVGTVCYMSPEEAQGHDVDARTDLFSLGAVLFEAASGRTPFHGSLPLVVIYAILNEEPPSLRNLNAKIPIELERIIHRLLSKSPCDRYCTAGDLLCDLKVLQVERLERASAWSLPILA